VAGDDTQASPPDLVPGLSNPKGELLERFLIRTRGGSATQSAWRLVVSCGEGQGTIILVETAPGESFYRGDGVFLGWPQERMEAAYQALLPRPADEAFELNQLG
jgi:hypothetical protein